MSNFMLKPGILERLKLWANSLMQMFVIDNNDDKMWMSKTFQGVRNAGFHYLSCLPETEWLVYNVLQVCWSHTRPFWIPPLMVRWLIAPPRLCCLRNKVCYLQIKKCLSCIKSHFCLKCFPFRSVRLLWLCLCFDQKPFSEASLCFWMEFL